MNRPPIILPFIIMLVVLLTISCETEKFLGYNYEAQEVSQTADISGQITNIFTGGPVRAMVDFEGQQTQADFSGQYQLNYFLTGDEALNRAIKFRLSAEKYHDLDTAVVIFPARNIIDAKMVYGAPIITDGTLTDTVVTATVFDYQGLEDIDSIFAIGFYLNDSLSTTTEEWLLMTQTGVLDANSGAYIAHLPGSVFRFPTDVDTVGYALVRRRFDIVAKDKAGFVETRHFSVRP